jgi:hypothetical protein
MKKEVQENKITPKKTVSQDSHTEEIKRYIKELNIESDKKHQKLREEANDDIRKFMAINTEDFQSRVSAIAEQFLGLNEKIDATNEKLDATTKTLTEKLDSHTVMISRLMIDVEEVKVGMREKVGRDEFNKLETRLVVLESVVFSGQGKTGQKSEGS